MYYPMYKIMDGSEADWYEHRVEPSVEGGKRIAKGLLHLIQHKKHLDSLGSSTSGTSSSSTSSMKKKNVPNLIYN